MKVQLYYMVNVTTDGYATVDFFSSADEAEEAEEEVREGEPDTGMVTAVVDGEGNVISIS
jgi:hypothetical protein